MLNLILILTTAFAVTPTQLPDVGVWAPSDSEYAPAIDGASGLGLTGSRPSMVMHIAMLPDGTYSLVQAPPSEYGLNAAKVDDYQAVKNWWMSSAGDLVKTVTWRGKRESDQDFINRVSAVEDAMSLSGWTSTYPPGWLGGVPGAPPTKDDGTVTQSFSDTMQLDANGDGVAEMIRTITTWRKGTWESVAKWSKRHQDVIDIMRDNGWTYWTGN